MNLSAVFKEKTTRKKLIGDLLPFAGLIFVFIFFLIGTKGRLVSFTNVQNLADQMFKTLIVSLGAVFIYAHGGFDMSLGPVSGVAQMVMALCIMRFGTGYSPLLILLLSLIICVAICSVNALVHIYLRVPIFVATMCTSFACTGLLVSVVQKQELAIPIAYMANYNTTIVRVIVLVIMIGLFWTLFEKTKIGRSLKAIGGSRTVAAQSGINIKKSILLAFVFTGICVGVVSFLSLSRACQVLGSTGGNIQMDVMIAIVLGGMPLSGGAASKIRSVIVGTLTITILTNGMTLMGIDYSYVNATKGLLFIIIVALSYRRPANGLYN